MTTGTSIVIVRVMVIQMILILIITMIVQDKRACEDLAEFCHDFVITSRSAVAQTPPRTSTKARATSTRGVCAIYVYVKLSDLARHELGLEVGGQVSEDAEHHERRGAVPEHELLRSYLGEVHSIML